MGLMSFIKKAGNKVFGRKAAPAPQPTAEAKVELTEEQKKIQALTAEVSRLGIPVSNLNLELGLGRDFFISLTLELIKPLNLTLKLLSSDL